LQGCVECKARHAPGSPQVDPLGIDSGHPPSVAGQADQLCGIELNGIRVIGVNPGPVNTDRIYNMLKKRAKDLFGDENRYGELESTYPLGRPAHVHEVTDLIVFLASYRAGYISGTIVTVDGGIASRRSII